jgi:SAM-dependent methyltransferase
VTKRLSKRDTDPEAALRFAMPDRQPMGSRKITEREVAARWDENAPVWADHVRKGYDVYREYLNNPSFLRLIGNQTGKNVLDAGCGEGHNTRIMARRGAIMTGVDISAEMIARARAEEEAHPLGIRYEAGSFTDLGVFPPGSFDTVVSFMALMDGPDFKKAARAIYRVVRAGGSLFFSISHPCFMTRGMGWVSDSRGVQVKLVQSDYFSKEHYVERWSFGAAPDGEQASPFAVPYFPMTLSEYVNQLIDAGFAIVKLQEPRPSARLCREQPRFERWRDSGAIFLHFHARRPAGRRKRA